MYRRYWRYLCINLLTPSPTGLTSETSLSLTIKAVLLELFNPTLDIL